MTAINCYISAYLTKLDEMEKRLIKESESPHHSYIFNISYPRAIIPIMTLLESAKYRIKPLQTIDSIERTDKIKCMNTKL